MSQALRISTEFGDISELAAGLADRVDEQQVILYGPDPYEEGADIDFELLLADGSTALAGAGRVRASFDGGDERPPEARYDIVVDSLQFEPRAEVVFERILLARGGEGAAERPTGEVDVQDVSAAEVSEIGDGGYAYADGVETVADASASLDEVDYSQELATRVGGSDYEEDAAFQSAASSPPPGQSAPPARYSGPPPGQSAPPPGQSTPPRASAPPVSQPPWQEESTGEVSVGDLDEAPSSFGGWDSAPSDRPPTSARPQPASAPGVERPPTAAPPRPPQKPAGFAIHPMGTNGHALSRPTRATGWLPDAASHAEPRPSSGLFQYPTATLPAPPRPPRPDIDSSMRVTRAPRPGEAPQPMPATSYGSTAASQSSEPDYAGYDDGTQSFSDESDVSEYADDFEPDSE